MRSLGLRHFFFRSGFRFYFLGFWVCALLFTRFPLSPLDSNRQKYFSGRLAELELELLCSLGLESGVAIDLAPRSLLAR